MTEKQEGGERTLFKNKVIEIQEVASDKFLVTFERQFAFKAGQIVAIATTAEENPRIYSVCSGENDSQLQVLFDRVADGLLTPILAEAKQGDFFYISEPYGSFLPVTDSPMWWIATGTGVAPFYSMFRSGIRPERLLQGAATEANFFFQQEFQESLGCSYIRCSTASGFSGEYQGRVTRYLEQQSELPSDSRYYLCGRVLMVVEVRDILISKGISFENIISEIFF